MWNAYLPYFINNTSFSDKLIHVGLGLDGVNPKEIVKNAETVLDIGCGDGINTFIASNVKCVKNIIGLDVSEKIINYNILKYNKENINFLVGDFMSFSYDTTFQLIMFIGSIDYIEMSEDFFEKLNSLTTKGSRCYIAKFHPFWTSLFDNDDDNLQLQNYFLARESIIHYGKQKEYSFKRYHYSISDFLNRFSKNGWRIIKFDEPTPNINTSAYKYTDYDKDDEMMKRMTRVPMTMIMEFERS